MEPYGTIWNHKEPLGTLRNPKDITVGLEDSEKPVPRAALATPAAKNGYHE